MEGAITFEPSRSSFTVSADAGQGKPSTFFVSLVEHDVTGEALSKREKKMRMWRCVLSVSFQSVGNLTEGDVQGVPSLGLLDVKIPPWLGKEQHFG